MLIFLKTYTGMWSIFAHYCKKEIIMSWHVSQMIALFLFIYYQLIANNINGNTAANLYFQLLWIFLWTLIYWWEISHLQAGSIGSTLFHFISHMHVFPNISCGAQVQKNTRTSWFTDLFTNSLDLVSCSFCKFVVKYVF